MKKVKLSKFKNIFNLMFLVLIIVVNVLLLFLPQYSKSKSSFIELKEKKETIETNDLVIQKNYIEIDREQKELVKKMIEGGEAEIKEKLLKQNINLDGLKLHIPSILIEFEQEARKNSVDLVIRYDLMKKSSEIKNEPKEIEVPKEVPEKKEREKTNLEKRKEETENIKKEVNEEIEDTKGKGGTEISTNDKPSDDNTLTSISYFDTENNLEAVLTTDDLPKIKGLEVTIIPLEVTGSYEGVRSYLRYLDTIDYIEPAFVELNSVGDTMHGVIVLYILHTIK